ncbi:hypothetical protein [Qipengyuania sp. JC766]|uniref:hypothetical protein n=1 Tax=Qipengyuania sp. JC766 TaxID=3232139 RepID=UPI0034575F69
MLLPAFHFGPSQGARSSRILASSRNLDAFPDIEARVLSDIPLAVAAWLEQREEDELYACLPLTRQSSGGRVLLRARYLRQIGGEPYGLASGLYLGPEALRALGGHAERIAHLLPDPESESAAAAEPFAVDPASDPVPADPVETGLEWSDLAIRIEDGTEPLAVTREVLAGMRHPEQARRVIGWCSSARFPRLGSIDPDAAFQLVVSAHSYPAGQRREALWNDGYRGSVHSPPPSWDAWTKIRTLLAADPYLREANGWALNFASLPPERIAGALLDRHAARIAQDPRAYLGTLLRFSDAQLVDSSRSRIADRIEKGDEASRGALLAALLELDADTSARLEVDGLFLNRPELAQFLPREAFRAVLAKANWLRGPARSKRHLRDLRQDQLLDAIDHALVQMQRGEPGMESAFDELVEEFFRPERSGVRASTEAGAFADAVSRLGIETVIPWRYQPEFYAWQREAPATRQAWKATLSTLKVPHRLSARPADLATLTSALCEVNASRTGQRGAIA